MANAVQRVLDEVKQQLPAKEVQALLGGASAKHPSWGMVHVLYPGFSSWLEQRSKWYDQQVGHWRVNVSSYRFQKDRYLRAVLDELGRIVGFTTGRALQAEIDATKLIVAIRPYVGSEDNMFNSSAIPVQKGCRACGFRKDMPLLDLDGDRVGKEKGNGVGVQVVVSFTPWIHGEKGIGGKTGPSRNADESLFHELIHGSRLKRGVVNPSYASMDYDNAEEFIAIVLTNIYLADKGQTVFRGSHLGRTVLDDADKFLDNPQGVKPSPRQLIDDFRGTQPDFYRALAFMKPLPRFNPVREFNDGLKP